jgi:hypothetical protein
MASNLSTIGLVFKDEAEFASAMVALAGEARERLSCSGGEYAIWRSRTGAEVWFQFSPSGDGNESEIIGLTPFYEGQSEVAVRVTEAYSRPGDTALEGAFMAWVADGPGDADCLESSGEWDGEQAGQAGGFPLVFDAVDFAAHAERQQPFACRVRLTGFAREVHAYPSADDYAEAQDRVPQFAPQAFVPVGMFAAAAGGESADDESRDAGEPPSSAALLTGEVVEHAILTNETSGRPFHWLLVRSFAADFDIVADPEVVSGEIVGGATVEVACLLFGRLLD